MNHVFFTAKLPLFEYRCSHCQKKFTDLLPIERADSHPACPKCSIGAGVRLVSRFVRGRSEEDRIDEIADRLENMDVPDGSSEMREMLRELGKASDDDLADDMEELFEADMEGKIEDDI